MLLSLGAVPELLGKDAEWFLQGVMAPGQPASVEEGGELPGDAGLNVTCSPLDVATQRSSPYACLQWSNRSLGEFLSSSTCNPLPCRFFPQLSLSDPYGRHVVIFIL